MDNRGNSRTNTCANAQLCGRAVFICNRTNPGSPGLVVIHNNLMNCVASAGDEPFKLLTYQLPTVGYWPTLAMTGNGELGFDTGEGA